MKFYKLELLEQTDENGITGITGVVVETKNFLHKKNAKVWLEKNGYERVPYNSSLPGIVFFPKACPTVDLFCGMDKTKYANGRFEEIELEDALITVELI